ncbi:MAG: creatininase family protein [Alphaproteobacteria bacterium]|nr:creatininase family protein [Alphaproteobacteria bacterium]
MTETAWRRWEDLRWPEFEALDPARTVALLPVAAIEQHGPHLPVSVDATINDGIVAAARAQIAPDVPVLQLPTQRTGKSNEHLAFPGTLTHSAATLTAMWTEIGEAVHRAGLNKLVLLNSHGGQPQIMDIVCRDLRVRFGMVAVAASWFAFGLPEGLFDAGEARWGIHAGEIETAMMRHLAPETVRMDLAEDFRSAEIDLRETTETLGFTGGIAMAWQSQDLHPSGAVGNAAAADAERGRQVVDFAGAKLATLLGEVSAYPLDKVKARG